MRHKYEPLKIALAVSALAIGLLFDGDFDRLMKEDSLVSDANASPDHARRASLRSVA